MHSTPPVSLLTSPLLPVPLEGRAQSSTCSLTPRQTPCRAHPQRTLESLTPPPSQSLEPSLHTPFQVLNSRANKAANPCSQRAAAVQETLAQAQVLLQPSRASHGWRLGLPEIPSQAKLSPTLNSKDAKVLVGGEVNAQAPKDIHIQSRTPLSMECKDLSECC
jgi:hypothetical protein